MSKDDNKEIAMNIISNKMNNLLSCFSEIEEDSQEGAEVQEKLEILSQVKDQVSMGNETLTQKVIEKNNKGLL